MERTQQAKASWVAAMMELVSIWFLDVYLPAYQVGPVTVEIVTLQLLSHHGLPKSPWNYRDTSNSSVEQINDKKPWWSRLFIPISELLHTMLFYMSSRMFIRVGVYLEPIYGSVNFALLLYVTLLACIILCVLSSSFFRFVARNNSSIHTSSDRCRCNTSFIVTVVITLACIVLCQQGDLAEDDPNEEIIIAIIFYWTLLVGCCIYDFRNSFVFCFWGYLMPLIYCCTSVGGLIDTGISKISNESMIHNEVFHRRKHLPFELYITTSAYLGRMIINNTYLKKIVS